MITVDEHDALLRIAKRNGVRTDAEREQHAAREPVTSAGRQLRARIHRLLRTGEDDARLASLWPHDNENMDEAAARIAAGGAER